jgi:hypothetical protein
VVITAHQVRSYVPSVTTEDRPHDPAPEYEIRVAGRLAPRWSAWFDGLTLTPDADGTTVLRGPVVDQAALHGLLQKLRDLGIPLVSLTQLPSTRPAQPAHPSNPAHTKET